MERREESHAPSAVTRLVSMLNLALEIIDEQSALLAQHGIETESGKLEERERKLREDAREWR